MKQAKGVEFQEWNVRFLRILWGITFLAFLVALILFFKFDDTENYSREAYFSTFVAIPALMQSAVCVIMEIFIRYISPHVPRKFTSMFVALSLEVNCGILVMVHTSVGMMAVALIIPVVLATVYNSRTILVAQSIFACIFFGVIQLFVIPNAEYVPENDEAVYIIIFVGLILATDLWMDMLIKWQISIQDEVAEYRQKTLEAEQEIQSDSLTGLWTNKAFVETLGERMKHLAVLQGQCVLMLIDINSLYKINEQYGYICGDEVILKLTEVIKRNIRSNDFVARYNGDEFMIILNDAPIEISRQIALRIRDEFEAYSFEKCNNERFTVSVGIAEWQDDYANELDFISKVEQAVRLAKLQDGDRISIYDGDNLQY